MGKMHQYAAGLSLAFALCIMGITIPVAAQGLPGGATSLRETHGDWTVTCQTTDGTIRCAMTQTQVNGENRQRVLAVELTTTDGGSSASGVLVLPFGLQLVAGVRLAIEENEALPLARFSTCLPAGCLVPLTFDAATLTALKAGEAISVTVVAHDSGQQMAFSISLTGFLSALNRVAQLIDS